MWAAEGVVAWLQERDMECFSAAWHPFCVEGRVGASEFLFGECFEG
jgi:hypothetical protein